MAPGAAIPPGGNVRIRGGQILINFDLDKHLSGIARNLQRRIDIFLTSLDAARPQFGAYMYYSRWLEAGTRRMRERPHVRPAVFGNRAFITRYIGDFAYASLLSLMRGGHAVNANDVRAAWVRALNSRPREHAVDSARRQEVFRFGFHIRSIRGYGEPRDAATVRAEQDRARAAIRSRLEKLSQQNRKRRTAPPKKRR